MTKKRPAVKTPRKRESNEEFLAASRMRSEAAGHVDAAATGMLATIKETNGAEIPREQWPLAELLASRGLITLGAPRGPSGDWRRAEVVADVQQLTKGLGAQAVVDPFDIALASAREAIERGAPRTHLVHEGARSYEVVDEPLVPRFPEHEKLKRVAAESQACGEFLEWLRQRYTLAEYHVHSADCVSPEDTSRYSCGMSISILYPSVVDVQHLLAKFFEIDTAKIEEEKRAMLKAQP
jgi:hypothetical protein